MLCIILKSWGSCYSMQHIFNHWVSQHPLQSEIKSQMMLAPPVDRWSVHPFRLILLLPTRGSCHFLNTSFSQWAGSRLLGEGGRGRTGRRRCYAEQVLYPARSQTDIMMVPFLVFSFRIRHTLMCLEHESILSLSYFFSLILRDLNIRSYNSNSISIRICKEVCWN